ncbi:MAG: phosphatidate cytidylyltransferase, partial [Candidatus Thorarchaeota archaeon]
MKQLVFNPLGAELALVWDIIAMVISLVAVMMVVQINGAIQKSGKLSSDVTRKIVHIFAAPVFLVTWMLYSGSALSRYIALIVPLLFVLLFVGIGTGRVVNEAFVGSMSRSGDPAELLKGTLYYALMICIVTVLWFYAPSGNPMAFIILGCLAGGDGLADVIGRKFGGEKKFGFGGAEKTVAGSIGMFLGSFLFSYIMIAIFSLEFA